MAHLLRPTPKGCIRALLGDEESCQLITDPVRGYPFVDITASTANCVLQLRLRAGGTAISCEFDREGKEIRNYPGA